MSIISPIKWKLGSYASEKPSVTEYAENFLNNPDYTVVWVDIVKLMQKTDPSQQLNLHVSDGGKHAKKKSISTLRDEVALKRKVIVPADVTINSGKIHFNNGRHRVFVAYILGARKAPIIVKLSELEKLGKILKYQEITQFVYAPPMSNK